MPCPIWLQSLLPQKTLSKWAGCLSDCKVACLKNYIIKRFCRVYGVDLSEAEIQDIQTFPSFNAFFTRSLKAHVRPLPTDPKLVCSPADGTLSELGRIEGNRLFQAKNHHYTLSALLGGDETMAQQFNNGLFMTVYLAPKNYHRVHMPLDGTLTKMIYVPGKLFSVNEYSVEHVSQIFARNERVISFFDTDSGPMAVILIGAMLVGSIETIWAGCVTSPRGKQVERWDYSHTHPQMVLKRGEEMGRFRLGSTAIVLLGENAAVWNEELKAGMPLKMGEGVGACIG